VKLYSFDEVDVRLALVPLAARRALDRAGLKLSLDGWRSLSLERRRAIAEAGSGPVVDVEAVTAATGGADPTVERIEPIDAPAADTPPPHVVRAFGPARPLEPAVWAALSSLDRYALAKVAARGRPERLAAAYDEIVGHTQSSTHIAPGGGVRMVDVSDKPATHRRAVAESRVSMNAEAMSRLVRHDVPKGDVVATARLAGIMAAKRTSDLIPLCHPLRLTHVSVEFDIAEADCAVNITAAVETLDRTGVEMEALVAASTASLTVYDMLKAFDRSMQVGPTRLAAKSGGRSGDYAR
jgi:cyclic pyranopterin monophosphate synthase